MYTVKFLRNVRSELDALSAADKQKIFEGNALKVYPRLKALIDKQARGNA